MSENSKKNNNSDHSFPEPKLSYLNCLFYLTNSLKLKDIQFIIIEDSETLQIFIW